MRKSHYTQLTERDKAIISDPRLTTVALAKRYGVSNPSIGFWRKRIAASPEPCAVCGERNTRPALRGVHCLDCDIVTIARVSEESCEIRGAWMSL